MARSDCRSTPDATAARGASGGPPARLRLQAAQLRVWLFDEALPLWAQRGADRLHGGFHEMLDQEGKPTAAAKRARVQARQAYVFATAGLLGWHGPWQEAASRGMAYLQARYRRSSGLFRTLVSRDGTPLDDSVRLYDQAFVLLAMARLREAGFDGGAMETAARELRQGLAEFRHCAGGFRENSDRPFQANAQMHLLEASMAWEAVSGDSGWATMAEEIVGLALDRFIDRQRGCLLEVFDASWRPASGDLGRLTEPGHQFEWSWLLHRFGSRRRDPRALQAARRLRRAGLAGVDPARGVAIDEAWSDGSARQSTARLWPQTEWLKAAIHLGEIEGDWTSAEQAAEALQGYLATPICGLWRDRRLETGAMQEEPAPASSFYHIITACSELFRVALRCPAASASVAIRGRAVTSAAEMPLL